jgi:4-amino-4-deoxy-L-arabinose transferase-like glycosyltransferase
MTTTELLHDPLRRRRRATTEPGPASVPPAPLSPSSDELEHARRDPSWARPALVALLLLTALAYIWDLSASGYANSFYAAAVQAGTKSWKAMFFGSLDSSNFITVDKPPASLWVMSLSGRIFGFSSWSMLVPQALEGVAAVGLLYATVKRWFGAGAGLAAGALFAATPVAALMFRFNNPDALLVLLLVASAYCLTRALERAGTRWVLAAGALVGAAFLAKMMQAFLVLPAFALVYAIAAPTTLRRRIAQLLAGGVALVLAAGWWVLIVALWPASSRPMIDGSSDNSILNLITGYNGLGRIFGSGGGAGGGRAGGGAGGGGGFSGATGVLRLFNDLMGAQASWLLPAAAVALLAGLWTRRGAPRTDRRRAALILWGGWLLVTAAIFSFGQGVIHTYYTVALAPAIAALVAIGGAIWWPRRATTPARLLAAFVIAGSVVWACALLGRDSSWEPWLTPLVATSGAPAVIGLLAAPALGHLRGRVLGVAVALGVLSAVSGPLAYAAYTASTPHTGSVVSAGPTSSGGAGAFGGGPGGLRGGAAFGGGTRPAGAPGGAAGSAGVPGGSPPTGAAGASQQLFSGSSSTGAGAATGTSGTTGRSGSSAGGSGTSSQQSGGQPGGGASSVSSQLVKALRSNAGSYRWSAATSGSQSAASLELASGTAVMGIGGFSNEGGNLSLAAFERYVAKGDIHYYVASQGAGGGAAGGPGGGGGPGGAGTSSSIASWVKANFKTVTLGSTTVYDLTQRA